MLQTHWAPLLYTVICWKTQVYDISSRDKLVHQGLVREHCFLPCKVTMHGHDCHLSPWWMCAELAMQVVYSLNPRISMCSVVLPFWGSRCTREPARIQPRQGTPPAVVLVQLHPRPDRPCFQTWHIPHLQQEEPSQCYFQRLP